MYSEGDQTEQIKTEHDSKLDPETVQDPEYEEDLKNYAEELESKCRDLGLEDEEFSYCADIIEAKKEEVKQLLRELGFTKEDFN